MNKIYVFNNIITIDDKSNTNWVLSLDQSKIYFPFFEISSPRYIYNETRFNIKNLFKINTIKFIEEIIVSFIDIQNEFLLEYISQLNNSKFNLDQDIFILSSTILTSKTDSILYWNKFNYEFNLNKSDIQTTIIDYCIQRSIS